MEEQSSVDLQTKEIVPYKQCLNCGTSLQGTYCHKCGQKASKPTPKIWEFIMEYVNNAFIWDEKCLRTMWQLIRRPGFLSNEFNAGKFVSYEHPLKLNMFFLFVFVTIFLLFSDIQKTNESFDEITKNEMVLPYLSLDALKENMEYSSKMKESERDTIQLTIPLQYAEEFSEIITTVSVMTDHKGDAMDTLLVSIPHILIEDGIIEANNSEIYSFSSDHAIVDKSFVFNVISGMLQKFIDIVTQFFPLIFLLTSPLLAFAVKIFHPRRKQPIISFFIFALHYTAFIELMLLVIYVLYLTADPGFQILKWIILLSSGLYLTIAVKNVYENNSWIKSLVKAVLISAVYQLICLMTFIIIFAISMFAVVIDQVMV